MKFDEERSNMDIFGVNIEDHKCFRNGVSSFSCKKCPNLRYAAQLKMPTDTLHGQPYGGQWT